MALHTNITFLCGKNPKYYDAVPQNRWNQSGQPHKFVCELKVQWIKLEGTLSKNVDKN